jgi:hypothetical protein
MVSRRLLEAAACWSLLNLIGAEQDNEARISPVKIFQVDFDSDTCNLGSLSTTLVDAYKIWSTQTTCPLQESTDELRSAAKNNCGAYT